MQKNNGIINVASFASRSELEFVLFTSLLESEGIEYHIFNKKDISSVGGWTPDAIEVAVRECDFESAKRLLSNNIQTRHKNVPNKKADYKPFCPMCDSIDVKVIKQETNFALSKYKCNRCNHIFQSIC